MKKWLLVLFPIIVFAQAPKSVQLHGKLSLLKQMTKVYISYRTPQAAVLDSLNPKNGVFTYKTKIKEPVLATIRVFYADSTENKQLESIPLFLEAGKITLTATDFLKKYTVRGSAAHKDYLLLTAQEKPYSGALEPLYETWKQYNNDGNTAAQEAVERQID